MNITLKQLRVFLEVTQRGSMIRAAQALHLTPSAISLQIKEIEAQLELTLFNRNKKQLSLSVGGDYFLGYARRVLAEIRETEIAIERFKRLERGLLTVGIAGVAEHIVPAMLARFHNKHPYIDVKMRVLHNREQLIDLMDAAEIDLSVTYHPPKESGVRAEIFGSNPLAFVCAPQYLSSTHTTFSIKQLASNALIVREQGVGARTAMETLFTKYRCTPNITMEITSNQTIKHAVMAGWGLGFLSLQTIELELRLGLLKVLETPETPVLVTWNIVHLDSRTLSPAAEAFRSFVLNQGAKDLRAHNSMLYSLAFKGKRVRRTEL